MKIVIVFLGMFGFLSSCIAQNWQKTETIKRSGYTLVFISKDSTLSADTRQRMIDLFFKVYPAEAKRFNRDAPRTVTFEVSETYKGVAATDGALTYFYQEYLRKHPEDIDVVTHEIMHIVQNYHDNPVPGWVTEGLADYARYVYGVNNKAAGWSLPEFSPSQSYTDTYRVTARFFAWMEKHIRQGIAEQVDAAARKGTYSPDVWVKASGKSLNELWYMYITNPAL